MLLFCSMAESEPHTSADAPGADEPAAEKAKRGLLRTILIVLGSVVGGLVVLVVLFVLALQLNWGAARFGNFLLGLANPFDEAEITYSRIEGSFITGVELHDVLMFRPDTVRTLTGGTRVDTLVMARVDTLRLRYNLLALLGGTVHVRELTLANPKLTARQQPDSTWDLLRPFAPDTTTADTTAAAFTFRLDRVRVTDADLDAHFYAPGRDSTLVVRGLYLRGSDVRVGEVTTARVDTLWAEAVPPGDTLRVRLAASAHLGGTYLTVPALTLSSPRSRLTARGTLLLPGDAEAPRPADAPRRADFTLRADPLDLADLRAFGLDLPGQVEAQLAATGTPERMQLDGTARLSGGGTLALDGAVRLPDAAPLAYQGTLELRDFNPGAFSPGQPDTGRLNADVRLDLSGIDPAAASGTVFARLFDSRFGTQAVREAQLRATLEAGVADYTLRGTLPGATLEAEGSGRFFDEVPTYTAQGGFRDVHLGRLTDSPSLTSDLNGRFSLEGRGFDPETATIAADVRLLASSLNGNRIARGTVDLALRGGDLDVEADLRTGAGTLDATAEATFRNDDLSYRVRGNVAALDIGRLLQNPQQQSNLNARFDLVGRGTDPATANVTANLALGPSTINDTRIDRGRAALTLDDGRLGFDVDFRSGGGLFEARGTGTTTGETLRYRVSQGRFENFNLAAFTGDPAQASDLTGTFTATGQGTDPAALSLEARLDLAPSTFGDYQIADARLEARLSGGLLRFDGRGQVEDARFNVAGTARPFDALLRYDARGRFENLDLSRFTDDPAQGSDLTGTFAATGRGTDLATLSLEAELTLEASRYNEQTFEAGRASVRLRSGRLAFDAEVRTPEGLLALRGSARLGTGDFELALEEGAFSGLNLGALLGNPALTTNLNGTVALDGNVANATEGPLDAVITLAPSTVNGARITEGRVVAAVRDGFVTAEATLDLVQGAARLSAEGRLFDEVPTYALEGRLTDVDVAALAGIDTLTAHSTLAFDVEGRGLDPATMTLEGVVAAGRSRYQDLALDTLYADLALAGGVLALDTLTLRSNVASAEGGGRIALFDTLGTVASDFRLTARFDSLEALRPFVGAEVLSVGEGTLTAQVYGPPGEVRFDATLDLSSLVYNDIRVAGLETAFAGVLHPGLELAMGEADVQADYLSTPQIQARRSRLEASYDGDAVRFDGSLGIDARRDAELRGRIDLDPDSQRVVLEAFNFRFDQDRWQLVQEATITYGQEYRISNFLLTTGDQQIAVDGVVDPDGAQSLVLSIERFRINAVADLLGYRGLDGTMGGSLLLTGPGYAPQVEGTLSLDLASRGREVGDLRLALAYDSLRLGIDAQLTHTEGGTLVADGYVPLDLRLAPGPAETIAGEGLRLETQEAAPASGVALTVVADSFSIGWIEPFLDPQTVDEIEGALSGTINVSGTFAGPLLDGQAVFRNGRLGLPELGATYSDIQAQLDLVESRVEVTRAVMRSGGGSLTATGSLNLAQLTLGEFDIRAQVDDFLAVDNAQYRAAASGTVALSGTTRQPIVSGDLRLRRTDIYLTNEVATDLEPVELTERDVRMLEQRFGLRVTEEDTTTFVFFNALAIDGLTVTMDRDTWLRSRSNPEMDIQFTGNLRVQKAAGSPDVLLFGTIEVLPERSRVVQFGKRFTVDSGTLTFNGPATDPLLNLQARYEVPRQQVAVILTIEGRLENLSLSFSSENPSGLELADIVSYIATGQPAGQGFFLGGGGGGLLGQAGGMALSTITSAIENAAASGLQLDVVEVEIDPQRGTLITAGKYVTPRLYFAVSQPISFSNQTSVTGQTQSDATQFTVEYELFNWLLTRLEQRGNLLGVKLIWEYAY